MKHRLHGLLQEGSPKIPYALTTFKTLCFVYVLSYFTAVLNVGCSRYSVLCIMFITVHTIATTFRFWNMFKNVLHISMCMIT
jgi:hypothetical protein